MKPGIALVVSVCAILLGLLSLDRGPSPWRPVVRPLATPAGAGSGQPRLTVSSRGVLLSWMERNGAHAALRFAERTPTGWTTVRTAARGDDWFVNWADVPSVLRLDDGTLVAHWLQKRGAAAYAYDVRLAVSTDDGRSWSPSFLPHHDGLEREHGFASLYQVPGAGLGLIWLDGRAMASAEGHGAVVETGAMSVRAATFDRQWRQTGEAPVDLRVCECCPTAAAMTSDGPIVAYRDRTGDEIRDIHVSRLEDGRWTEPRAVHADGWRIAACPVNGPALDARGRAVVLAWFTGVGDVGHAYAAFSRDGGRTFGDPIRLDERASLGRVAVALLPDGSAAATWIELADARASVALRRVRPDGGRSPMTAVTPVAGSRASGYPRIAYGRGELVFAWVEGADTHATVKTAIVVVPAR